MKLLFIARHFTYFRNYDSVLRMLAERGHAIHLAVEKEEQLGGRVAIEALTRECPRITVGMVPERRADAWSGVARRLRLGMDYLRYAEPAYDAAPLLRARARQRTPRAVLALADAPIAGSARGRRVLARTLQAIDSAVPPAPAIVEYLQAQRPDALLITPLVELGSQQIDYLRAARLLGIPSGVAVWSWDHLSSKAYIREMPDRLFVWNETQRREATSLHGIPADRVRVTGAQCFDRWFDRLPSRDRETFCGEVGLPNDRPMVLWVCSSLIKGSPAERPFVVEWLQRLRASSDPAIASAGVLIRPHPSRAHEWHDVDLSALGPVAVRGGNPVDDQTRADYFDALYHSAAVAGLNTSAFIEAAIVGREVLTILPAQYHDNQEGTLHFRYLLDAAGGFLRVARTFDEHVEQLGVALSHRSTGEHPHRRFLESFVRPAGLNVAATPAFVEAVEELPSVAPVQTRKRAAGWRRTALGATARMVARLAGESMIRSPRELDPARQARIAAAAQAGDSSIRR